MSCLISSINYCPVKSISFQTVKSCEIRKNIGIVGDRIFAFSKGLDLNQAQLFEKKLETKGFEQHAEILCKVVKSGKMFYEIPISYNGRSHEEGKKIKFYHIFSVLFRIVFERFR